MAISQLHHQRRELTQPCPFLRALKVESLMARLRARYTYMSDHANVPVGWPLLAREQDSHRNKSHFRSFGNENQRVLLYEQGRIGVLAEHLKELDREGKYLRGLTPYQERRPGAAVCMEEYDAVIEELRVMIVGYRALLHPGPCRIFDYIDGIEIIINTDWYHGESGRGGTL